MSTCECGAPATGGQVTDERSKLARAPLGHTETIMVKLHPDLKAHLETSAAAGYCTVAEYVRQLIVADMRSTQKKKDDVVLHALKLCSGYDGMGLGLQLAGVACRTVAHVERDAYAAAVLVARMEDKALDPAPIWDDLTTFDGRPWRGRVDLVTAGFPCQPFSAAGQRVVLTTTDGSGLTSPESSRSGTELVFLENVPGSC